MKLNSNYPTYKNGIFILFLVLINQSYIKSKMAKFSVNNEGKYFTALIEGERNIKDISNRTALITKIRSREEDSRENFLMEFFNIIAMQRMKI